MGPNGQLQQWIIPITSTTACILETILTFHSILSDRFRFFRGRAQPLLSMTASVKQHTRKEPTIVQGDAPHSPPFGVTRRRSQMSSILFNRAGQRAQINVQNQRERKFTSFCRTTRTGHVVVQGSSLGVNMVDGTLGHLTATEARAFNDVVGEFGASDGGI